MNIQDIKQVAVIGVGTMGEGIVQSFATAGFNVRGIDLKADILSACLRQIESNLQLFGEFGLLREASSSILSRIETFLLTDLSRAIKGCHVIVECIPEILQLKRDLFSQLDSCPDPVILASNTSNYTITAISQGMKTPHRVVGIHYFNPAHIMPLVEIQCGKDTADGVVETARELMIKTGKTPILVRKEMPGFVVNRVQAAMGREVSYLIEQGVISPEEMDLAAKASYGFRLACSGPMEQQDLSGLDTLSRGQQQLFKVISNSTEPSSLMMEKVKKGELGVKSGKGWYSYEGKTRAQILEERDRKLLKQLILYNQNQGLKAPR
jgi:3-hydroxybutyryl-CoA dehydrogenase